MNLLNIQKILYVKINFVILLPRCPAWILSPYSSLGILSLHSALSRPSLLPSSWASLGNVTRSLCYILSLQIPATHPKGRLYTFPQCGYQAWPCSLPWPTKSEHKDHNSHLMTVSSTKTSTIPDESCAIRPGPSDDTQQLKSKMTIQYDQEINLCVFKPLRFSLLPYIRWLNNHTD